MQNPDPFGYDLLTYLWVIVLSLWGGVVNFFRKMKAGKARPFNITELVGELMTSAFAGILTFYLCEAASFSPVLTAALVGVSGHMGSRAIFHLEQIAESRLGKMK